MDNIPEREQSKPERSISLGERFQPFDPLPYKKSLWFFNNIECGE
jgi:hypothetical protein